MGWNLSVQLWNFVALNTLATIDVLRQDFQSFFDALVGEPSEWIGAHGEQEIAPGLQVTGSDNELRLFRFDVAQRLMGSGVKFGARTRVNALHFFIQAGVMCFYFRGERVLFDVDFLLNRPKYLRY